jgi:hypothetical protein
VIVRYVQFDCFGERLPESAPQVPDSQDRVSRWMLRAGVGLFWSLVAVVITARVVYFDPDPFAKFGQLAAISSAVRAIFGA